MYRGYVVLDEYNSILCAPMTVSLPLYESIRVKLDNDSPLCAGVLLSRRWDMGITLYFVNNIVYRCNTVWYRNLRNSFC